MNLSEGLIIIRREAFSGCKITSLVCPSTLKTIEREAFSYCTSLTSVLFNEGLSNIGIKAFTYTNLEEVNIPNSASLATNYDVSSSNSYYYTDEFSNCYNLKKVTISSRITYLRYTSFRNCNNIQTFIINPSTQPIHLLGYRHEYNPESFFKVLHPEKVVLGREVYSEKDWDPETRTHHNNAFVNVSSLKEIEIGEDVTTLLSFASCENLSKIIVKRDTPPLNAAFDNGVSFSCNTDGVTFHSSIVDSDIKSYVSDEIQLNVTYNISVYATKPGYENSDVATATLCWVDMEPQSEGLDGITQIKAQSILIQSENGCIEVKGLDDNKNVYIYGINGQLIGSTISKNGYANFRTNLQVGTIVIVKIGDKSIKTFIK